MSRAVLCSTQSAKPRPQEKIMSELTDSKSNVPVIPAFCSVNVKLYILKSAAPAKFSPNPPHVPLVPFPSVTRSAPLPDKKKNVLVPSANVAKTVAEAAVVMDPKLKGKPRREEVK